MLPPFQLLTKLGIRLAILGTSSLEVVCCVLPLMSREYHEGLGSQNIFVYNGTARRVFTIGLEDVVVVEMEDTTVICHRQAVQRVKELAEQQQQKA